MKVVYLSKNKPSFGEKSTGLSTRIKNKIYFVDRNYQEVLNKPGIAFVDVTKEKDKYGFIGGSYSCSVESDKDKLLSYVSELGGFDCLPEFFLYGNCLFAIVRDENSDGVFSIYYCLKGEDVSKLTISTYKGSARALNVDIQSNLRSHSQNVTGMFASYAAIELNDENKIVLFNKISKTYYSCPTSVYISQDKKFCKIVQEGPINQGCHYYTLVPKFSESSLICVDSLCFDNIEFDDVTGEFLSWCNSIYLSGRVGYLVSGYGEVHAEFMNAKNSVLLVSKYADDPERVYKANKEEIDESVEKYKKWVAGLKKYVTVSNAKQYHGLFLDKLLWTGSREKGGK